MKVLLLVDIQEEYGCWFSWFYLLNTYKYVKRNKDKYDEILAIIEPKYVNGRYTSDRIPKCILDLLTKPPLYKLYNLKFFADKLGIEEDLVSLFPNNGVYSIKGKDFVFITQENGRHYGSYLSKGLKKLLTLPKDTEIELIGGGRHKCVSLTYSILTQLGYSNVTITDKYCYDIYYICSNKHKNIFKTPVIKSFIEEYKVGNTIELVEIPFDNEF